MKIFYGIISFLLIVILWNGCIEVKTLVNVNPDGSGTLEETVLLNKEIVGMISQFSPDSSNGESFNLLNEADLKEDAKKYGRDVNYVSSLPINEKDKEGYKVVYSFKNLSDIKINENPGGRIPDIGDNTNKSAASSSEPENIIFNFIEGNPSEIKINFPEEFFKDHEDNEELKKDTVSKSDSIKNSGDDLKKLMWFLKDMKVLVELKINGDIKETNASYVDGSKITLLELDFNEILNDSLAIKAIEMDSPENIEKLKEMVKNVSGIKVELNNPVTIKFD